MTPHELNLAIIAHTDTVRHEQEQSITQAYLTAIWARWVKKPPKINQVLNKLRLKKTTRMTPEQWLKMLKAKERGK